MYMEKKNHKNKVVKLEEAQIMKTRNLSVKDHFDRCQQRTF